LNKKLKQEQKSHRRSAYCKRRNMSRYARKRNSYSREKAKWKFYCRNEKKVAQELREGRATCGAGTGWGFFDKFYIFLWNLGFFVILEKIEGEGYERVLISITKLLLTYSIKILLGITSLNKVPYLLFREIALLQLIGFTALEIKEGVCKRGKGKSQPMHKDTVGDFLSRLTEKEVEYILNATVKLLSEKRFLRSSTFILDSTDLFLPHQIEGAGCKKYKEYKYDRKEKKQIEFEVVRFGFKLIVLLEAKSMIIVAAKVAKLNEHESNYTLSLLDQARKNIGNHKIKLLLIDNAFMDGQTLWKIKKHYKINFIVRVRTTMNIAADARSMRTIKPDNDILFYGEAQQEYGKTIKVMGIPSLTSYDQYGEESYVQHKNRKDFKGNPINAVMVLCWDDKNYLPGNEPVFITGLKVNDPLDIINKYDLRSLIENCCFRELKQGWNLGKFCKKTFEAIRSHSILTAVMFSLNAAFQSLKGKSVTRKGIRRLRDEDMHSIHKVAVFADDYFGIFDIEEILIITRAPPRDFFRINPEEAKKRLSLKD
jgi:Transposase DDE domain